MIFTGGNLILGFALKAGLTEDEAAEVVQETLIGAAKHLPGFRYDPKVCSFKTWLLNLSNWRVKDQIRKRQVPSAPSQRGGRAHPEKQDGTSTATAERVPDPAGSQLEALSGQRMAHDIVGSGLPENQNTSRIETVADFRFVSPQRMAGPRGRKCFGSERRASLPRQAPHLGSAQERT